MSLGGRVEESGKLNLEKMMFREKVGGVVTMNRLRRVETEIISKPSHGC